MHKLSEIRRSTLASFLNVSGSYLRQRMLRASVKKEDAEKESFAFDADKEFDFSKISTNRCYNYMTTILCNILMY